MTFNISHRYLIKYTPWFLLILNLILKTIFIAHTSIAGDEPFSIYHAQLEVHAIIDQLSTGNNPPLYELFLHYWIKIWGIDPWAVRLPSVIFSSMTVGFVYKFGKSFLSYTAGLTAGLLFTFSNLNLLLAHEARVYALMVFLTTGSMYFFMKSIFENRKIRDLSLLFVCNGLLLYAHYFGFWVIGIQTLAYLVNKSVRNNLGRNYWYVMLALVIVYLPNLGILYHRFWDSALHGTWLPAPEGMADLYNMLRQFSNQPLTTVFCLLVCVGFLIRIIIRKKFTGEGIASGIIWIWWLFPFLGMFMLSFRIPMYYDRYLLFITPGYYLCLAWMAESMFSRKKWVVSLSGIMIILFLVTFNPDKDNKRHVSEVVSHIKSLRTGSETAVLFCPSVFLPNFVYYYDRRLFQETDAVDLYVPMRKGLEESHIFAVDRINDDCLKYPRIIYLESGGMFSEAGQEILKVLKSEYHLKSTAFYEEIFWVYEFER